MSSIAKRFQKLVDSADSVHFAEFISVIEACGFRPKRTNGSHHLFSNVAIGERLNVQNAKGMAKGYQVRQFLRIAARYDLRPGNS